MTRAAFTYAWLVCDSCDFGYANRIPGERCADLSWLHSDYPQHDRWPVQPRGYNRWLCRGRVWPEHSPHLRARPHKQLAEQKRKQALVAELLERNRIALQKRATMRNRW